MDDRHYTSLRAKHQLFRADSSAYIDPALAAIVQRKEPRLQLEHGIRLGFPSLVYDHDFKCRDWFFFSCSVDEQPGLDFA